jgi:ankyrin repeat protein
MFQNLMFRNTKTRKSLLYFLEIYKIKKILNLVREYINEVFTDESDPIKDIGIGILSVIKKYLQQSVSYDISNEPLENLLTRCILLEKYDYINYLVELGVNVNYDEYYPLRLAAFNDYYKISILLIEKGANLDSAIKYSIKNKQPITLENLRKIKRMLKNND